MSFPSSLSRLFSPLSFHLASPKMSTVANTGTGASGASAATSTTQLCTVAAGCFWGTEHMYRQHFGNNRGLVDLQVGYIGGNDDATPPSYRAVCGGKTGHAEAAQIRFDPALVSYRQLLEFFYAFHDPTTVDAQGPDRGSQYRSAIFFHDAEQERVARDVTDRASRQWWGGRVATRIEPAGRWWPAEQYHQLYLANNPGGYECPSHYLRSFKPLE